MPSLRDRGVYRLPDGRPYVALRNPSGDFFLFDLSSDTSARPVFEVTPGGLLARRFGRGPEWVVGQLEDTGQTFDDGDGLDRPA